MIGRKTRRNSVGQWYHVKQWQKFCAETLKTVFSNAKKMASRNILRHFFYTNFFMCMLLIRNQTVFSFNLKLICTSEFFKKLKLHSPKQLVQFQLLKTQSCKLIPNWTRNRMITYTDFVMQWMTIYAADNAIDPLIEWSQESVLITPWIDVDISGRKGILKLHIERQGVS